MVAMQSITPIAGLAGETVHIHGSEFTETMQVALGGVAAVVTARSATELAVVIPAASPAGPVDVTVSAEAGVVQATLPRGLYIMAAEATFTPDNLVQGSARAVFIDGRPVGFTDGPVRLAHEVSLNEAEVEQEVGAVKLFKNHERWRLSLALAEVSLENLCIVFDAPAVSVDGALSTLCLGGNAAVTEHSVLVQGPGPCGTLRDFFAYRAVVEEHDPLIIARDAPQKLPFTFRLLPELRLPAGQRILRIAECGVAS